MTVKTTSDKRPGRENEEPEASGEPVIPEEKARKLHYYLRLTRETDDRFVKMHRQGAIRGNHYPAVGQEATTVVPAFFMEQEDFVGPSHRELGVFLTKGRDDAMPLIRVVDQMLSKESSQDKGRNNPTHWGWTPQNIMEHCSNLGTQIPLAAGAALTYKIKRKPYVGFAFIGEGGSSKGDFHEACNFVGVHNLPFVIVIQNNFWAESVHISLQTGNDDLSERAEGYGFEGVRIDGNDVVQCYKTFKRVIEKARNGEGPTMVQCDTYRWYGHSMVDPANYRTGEEEEFWKKRDPVKRFERWLVENEIMTEDEIEQRNQELHQEILDTVETAKAESPEPDPSIAFGDVYATSE